MIKLFWVHCNKQVFWAFVNFLVLTFVSMLQPCFNFCCCPFSRLLCLFGNNVFASVASCSLLAVQNRAGGWGSSAGFLQNRGLGSLICCRCFLRRRSHSQSTRPIPMLNQGNTGRTRTFFSREAEITLSEQSKIKLLLRLAAFIDTLLA